MRNRRVRHALLLAAGRGTRMKDLTDEIPKPMLQIAGKPLLERTIDSLREAGIEHFTIITGYRPEAIEEHFGDGSRFGITTVYVRQKVQDGTAHALLLGRDAVGQNPFLLGWGDILTDPGNYPPILERFTSTGCRGVLSVNWVEDPYRGAAVYADDAGRIERIEEKPPRGTATTHWNNAGIGVFDSVVFDYAARVPRSPRGEYEIPDALSAMMKDGLDLRCLELEGLWSDVGTLEDLAALEGRFSAE